MNQKLEIIDRILFSLIEHPEIATKEQFHVFKNNIYRDYKIEKVIPSIALIERYNELIDEGKMRYDIRIHKLLRKRAIRSLSGVAVISVLTKFWGCPGKCIYCPTNENLPKSYIPNEPAVMRAELNAFDPIRQVQNRLRSLEITGHTIDKCDVRIIGGTWSFYPKQYQEEYIKGIYDAHTNYSIVRKHIANTSIESDTFATFRLEKDFVQPASTTLEEAKKRNETAECRVIGIAIETRPDWITLEEIMRLRSYGVTRVEIGYQTTFDDINELNKRGHGNAESIRATRLLKDAGFKVVAHMMPNLLGSTPERDIEALARVFDDSDFRPDELKIYPMVVTPNSELTEIWKQWGFKSYDDATLVDLMARMQGMIPEYIRLNRMYRDIPASEILEGSKLANLRQVTDAKMKEYWITRKDISAREIRLKENDPTKAILDVQEYGASGGKEYFLQFIDPEDRTLFSLLRLRIPSLVFEERKKLPPDKGDWGGFIQYDRTLTKKAQELRKNMSEPEKRVWQKILSYKQFEELKFTRQKPLLTYIVDFYCSELKLAIEIDWESHAENKTYDLQRSKDLESHWIQVIRYTNQEVIKNIEGVYIDLVRKIEERKKELQTPQPPLSGGDSEHSQITDSPVRGEVSSILPELDWCAIVRELHTFGDQLRIWEKSDGTGQHMGFGKRLMAKAEQIILTNHPEVKKIAVIAWVGVRGYYEKLGYELVGGYMMKTLYKK